MPESPNLLSAEQPSSQELPTQPSNPKEKETPTEQTSENQEINITPIPSISTPTSQTTLTDPDQKKLEKIEEILAEDLDDLYNSMTPQQQQTFKTKGEETAIKIKQILDSGKTHFKKIVELIQSWLQLIPGVNKYFLEKEAKIKADQIVENEQPQQLPIIGVLLAQAGDLANDITSPFKSIPEEPVNSTVTSLVFAEITALVIGGIVVIGIIIALFYIIRHFLRKNHNFGLDARQITLLLSIPKEQQMKDKIGDVSVEQIRSQISIGEQFMAVIGGMRAQHGIVPWLFGRSDQLSFEIVAQKGLIYFYMTVPAHLKEMIEQQLQAQFPSVQIEEVKDYNFFNPKDYIVGAYLKYERSYAYPFKTYQDLETDPLNGLLNPLTKIGEDAGVAIQYVVRSAKAKWRYESKKRGKHLAEGKSKNIMDHAVDALHSGMGSTAPTKDPHNPTPLQQEMIKKIDEKQSHAGLDCNTRVIVSAPQQNTADLILKNVLSGFNQYNFYQFGNSFKAEVPKKPDKIIKKFIYREYDDKHNMLVNTEELTSLWHLPTAFTDVPNIKWLGSRKAAPPDDLPNEGTLIGFNEYRKVKKDVFIKRTDRRRHLYVIGMTGTGKSTLLSNLAAKDIVAGEGLCVMDPHGELAGEIMGTVPPERIDDVIYFNPGDTGRPFGLNMLEFDPKNPETKTKVINQFIGILDRLYNLKETGGPMFETYLRNSILLNMGHPESGNTIMEISKVLADEDFRRFKLSKCENKPVVDFWVKEAEKAGGEASLANMVPYITSKLNQFIGNDIMRPIIAQQKSSFDIREVMDQQKILFINLSKGTLGEMNSNLLGMIIIGKLSNAALSRADMPAEDRKDFYVYLDEFQNFLTDNISEILAEARKYKLILNMAHQYIGQLESMKEIRDAIFGNVGSKVSFRIGVEDAEFLEKEYQPVFNQNDLMNVPFANAYIKLMIDGTASKPFNIETYPPPSQDENMAEALKEISRLTYGRDREIVEREIKARSVD